MFEFGQPDTCHTRDGGNACNGSMYERVKVIKPILGGKIAAFSRDH